MALEKINGIVIDVIRHNDRHNVVTLFTRQRGRVTFISSAGTGPKGKARNARLLPLSVIEADVRFNATRELQTLGAVDLSCIRTDIYFNPVKASIVMFLTEFLNRYLRDTAYDPSAYDFIVSAVNLLEKMESGVANFHIFFLLSFLGVAGISPDLSDLQKGDWFDMRLGEPVAERPLHQDVLTPAQTELLPVLLRMNVLNISRFRFSAADRREILYLILKYIAIYYPGMANMKSLDILSEIFG